MHKDEGETNRMSCWLVSIALRWGVLCKDVDAMKSKDIQK